MIRALSLAYALMASPLVAEDHELAPRQGDPKEHSEAEPGGSGGDPGAMTPGRLVEIVVRIDPEAQVTPNGLQFLVEGVPVLIIMDPLANRMRAMVHVATVEDLDPTDLLRMMQANFDTALDARYAIAGGQLWSVFIHPLGELQDRQLVSGIAQAVTLAQTYGSTYNSGGAMFGRGDSSGILQDLLEGEEI